MNEIKTCFICKEDKSIVEFSKNARAKDKLNYMCKACAKIQNDRLAKQKFEYEQYLKENHPEEYSIYMEEQRKRFRIKAKIFRENNDMTKHYRDIKRTWRARHPEKARAQSVLTNNLKAGKIDRPDACSCCGIECKPEAHHPDYSNQLEVVWLCRECHLEEHRELATLARKEKYAEVA